MSRRRRRPARGKPRGKLRGVFRLAFVLLLLAAGIAAGWLWQRYTAFADQPLSGIGTGETLVVERGDSLPRVVARLREAGVREGHRLEWQVLARQLGAADRLQVGEYALEPDTTPRRLLEQMRDGEVIGHRFTLVEGWNIRELRAALAKATPLEHEATAMDDAAVMRALGHAGQHPEGRFLPETYVYTRGDSDLDILRRAHAGMH